MVEIDEDGLWPFVDAILKDPAGPELAALPVDDEGVDAVAGVGRELGTIRFVVCGELPAEGDELGKEVLVVEVAELRDSAALDRSLTERLEIRNVQQFHLFPQQRLAD